MKHRIASRGVSRGRAHWCVGLWGVWVVACAVSSVAADGFPAGKLPTGKIAEVAAGAVGQGVATDALVEGLREMLKIATANAVRETGRADGYLGNAEIRIPLPKTLEGTAGKLRSMQLGGLVDDLEVSMNRAAEQAAAEAQPVFDAAIEQLAFTDAAGIMAGGERAATDFFRDSTSEQLAERFRPIVQQSMEKVGLAKVYDGFVAPLAKLPFASAPKLDLAEYVTEATLAGLFTMLAKEEVRLRSDPAARSGNPVLENVLGSGS